VCLGVTGHLVEERLVANDGECPRLQVDGVRCLRGGVDQPTDDLLIDRLLRMLTRRTAARDGLNDVRDQRLACNGPASAAIDFGPIADMRYVTV